MKTIRKIVSGGQTGADRAALDFAIEVGIPHDCWIPKGELTEAGPLPIEHQLKEMPIFSYPAGTEQNVIDSDATLIISHGSLTGGSLKTKKIADRHRRPCLHIDLTGTNQFQAARKIFNWVGENVIVTLFVAGPKANEDPQIYRDTQKVLKAFYHLATMNEEMLDFQRSSSFWPRTIEEVIEDLLSIMSLKDRVKIGRMAEDDLVSLHPGLGAFIRDKLGLSTGNRSLMTSCRLASGGKELDADSASYLIIKKLWERIKLGYLLRMVQKNPTDAERTYL